MNANNQHVLLQGGSFDGQVAEAPLPPDVLRLGVQRGKDKWEELYIYGAGITAPHEEYGDLPVMLYTDEGNRR